MLLFEKIAYLEKNAETEDEAVANALAADAEKKELDAAKKKVRELEEKGRKKGIEASARAQYAKDHGIIELANGDKVPLGDYGWDKEDVIPLSSEGDLYGKAKHIAKRNPRTIAEYYHNGAAAANHGITSLPGKILDFIPQTIHNYLQKKDNENIFKLKEYVKDLGTTDKIKAVKDNIASNRELVDHIHSRNVKLSAGLLGGAGLLGLAALLGSKSNSQPPALSNPLQYESDYYH